MKIAIFTDTFPPQINGVATSTYNLVKVLRLHGHKVLVVTVRRDDGKFEYKDDMIQLPGFELKKLYGYRGTWIYSSRAAKIVLDFKPDLIHNQTDAPVGIFARTFAARYNIPLVYTYHTQYEDYTYYVTRGYFDRIARSAIRKYSTYLTKTSTAIISPSMKTKEMLRGYGVDSYISVFPTGIDFSLFDIDKQNIDELRKFKEEHHISDDTKVFLSLGRVAKEKSIDVTLKSYALFLKEYPEIKSRLLVVGGGPALNSLKILTEELKIKDHVEFLGPVPAEKVPFYYHLADVFTSASITETQGLTFMEAMAANTIVLARYDDNLTGVIEDGKTGFFFTSPETFVLKAKEIFSLSEDKKKKLLENAYNIIDVYSIEKFYENIMEVYKRSVKANW